MIKVWGRTTSGNVQKVLWALAELGLPFERADIGGPFGGNREPGYLAMNPNGLVPTLQDGDLIMWESNAIVRYLARQYGAGTLEPREAHAIARANQWMDWKLTIVGPAHVPAFFNLVFKTPQERDLDAIEKGLAAFTSAMSILDAHLQKSAFVAGDAFSMGDIPLGVMGHRLTLLAPNRPSMPGLDRWLDALRKRPGFRDHVEAIKYTIQT